MKKLFLLLSALATLSVANAQPGTWLVYGTAGYDNNTYDVGLSGSNTAITWAVNPGIGYQFNQHLTVGVQGGYSYTSNSNPIATGIVPLNYNPYLYSSYYYGNPTSSYNWTAGAFARYTHWLGNIFFVYGQVNMSYLAGNSKYDNSYNYGSSLSSNEISLSSTGFQTMLYPGIGANIYKGLALTFDCGGINYINQSQDNYGGGQSNSSHININFAQQVNIGISKNLAMHHHKHAHHEPGAEYRRHANDKDDDDDDAPPPAKKSKK